MKFAHVFSRLSVGSVVLASAVALSACNGHASSSTAPATTGATTEAETATTGGETAAAPPQHGPAHFLFKQVQALDLRDDQRAAVTEAQENLRADMAPHREVLRQVAKGLADGIEAGHLDPEQAAAHQAALSASLADLRVAFATAMNSVHDTLDASQRATLVANLRAIHEGRAANEGSASEHQHQGPLAKLALEIGLSEEQKATLKDAIQQSADELFPNRKERREAQEAEMKAMAQAFISDDFDAQTFELWGGAEHGLEAFSDVATRAIDVSEKLLNATQRQALAETIREHATKI